MCIIFILLGITIFFTFFLTCQFTPSTNFYWPPNMYKLSNAQAMLEARETLKKETFNLIRTDVL